MEQAHFTGSGPTLSGGLSESNKLWVLVENYQKTQFPSQPKHQMTENFHPCMWGLSQHKRLNTVSRTGNWANEGKKTSLGKRGGPWKDRKNFSQVAVARLLLQAGGCSSWLGAGELVGGQSCCPHLVTACLASSARGKRQTAFSTWRPVTTKHFL